MLDSIQDRRLYSQYIPFLVSFFLILATFRGVELAKIFSGGVCQSNSIFLFYVGLWADWKFVSCSGVFIFPLYFLLSLKSSKAAKFITISIFGVLAAISSLFSIYFLNSWEALDERITFFSTNEIRTILKNEGVALSFWTVIMALSIATAVLGLIHAGIRNFGIWRNRICLAAFGISIVIGLFGLQNPNPAPLQFQNETEYQQACNKVLYFISSLKKAMPRGARYSTFDLEAAIAAYHHSQYGKQFTDSQFPLVHCANAPNVLGPNFPSETFKPNIVLIISEGLARPYSGPRAKMGSFTPFLDSIAQVSLYWENFFASSDRTYGALPNIFASMPLGRQRGVLSQAHAMPCFLSLFRIAQNNGYSLGFFYGGWLGFDGMNRFVLKNNILTVLEESDFPEIARCGNWGVPDKTLFDSSFSHVNRQKEPYLNGYLTLSLHSPYTLPPGNDPSNTLSFSMAPPQFVDAMRCAEYSDDALSEFISDYKTRPEYSRTIFIITGDHCIEKLAKYTHNPLDHYHVPLLIFSPMLKKAGAFQGICTHHDILPTLAALLHDNFGVAIPETNPWTGSGLDTSSAFRCIRSFPLGRITGEHDTYIEDAFLLLKDSLFKIDPCLDLSSVKNPTKQQKMESLLQAYQIVNDYVCQQNRLWYNAHFYDNDSLN